MRRMFSEEQLKRKITEYTSAVTSVNAKTGDIVLKASDIKANNTQTIEHNLNRIDERIDNHILYKHRISWGFVTDNNESFHTYFNWISTKNDQYESISELIDEDIYQVVWVNDDDTWVGPMFIDAGSSDWVLMSLNTDRSGDIEAIIIDTSTFTSEHITDTVTELTTE